MTQDTTAPVQDMLDRMEQFFRHYLHCSTDQRIVLQFWTLHTHCFAAATATSFLFIHSPEKQSGKTLCLQLLNLLCADPWYSAGVTPAVLAGKITAQHPTVLLDDCHITFSPASRARVCALLMQGARRGGISVFLDETLFRTSMSFVPRHWPGTLFCPPALQSISFP